MRPRAVVVVAHGLGEHSGRYGNVVQALVPRGYAIYAIDHRGHGRSGGPRAYIEHLDAVVDDFEQFRTEVCGRHLDAPPFVIGHSFGGLVALAHAVRFGRAEQGLVLSAPASAGGKRTSLVPSAALPTGRDGRTDSSGAPGRCRAREP